MPKYTYNCTTCGNPFQHERKDYNPDKFAPCPYCDGMGKLGISAPNVIFRGPGFSRRNADPHLVRNPNHRNTDHED